MKNYEPRNDLKAEIILAGTTQTAVAAEIGINRVYLSAVLSGGERLTPRLEKDIARAITKLAKEAGAVA